MPKRIADECPNPMTTNIPHGLTCNLMESTSPCASSAKAARTSSSRASAARPPMKTCNTAATRGSESHPTCNCPSHRKAAAFSVGLFYQDPACTSVAHRGPSESLTKEGLRLFQMHVHPRKRYAGFPHASLILFAKPPADVVSSVLAGALKAHHGPVPRPLWTTPQFPQRPAKKAENTPPPCHPVGSRPLIDRSPLAICVDHKGDGIT